MSNQQTPAPTRGVPVTLDKVRHIRYSFATIRKIREEFGDAALGKMGEGQLAKILLYGLQHEDPELTEQALEDLIDMQNLKEVVQAMSKAMGYSGAEVKADGPFEAPAAASGAAGSAAT